MDDYSKKVSVIVPVYNVEKYIEKCVDSIINQDYHNIEVILVDDGSPDQSPMLIDKIKLKDDRIVVAHKKNGGVSSARNVGLDMATGDYIMFVDGDDWVDRDYVSYFLNMVSSGNFDIGMNINNYYDDVNSGIDRYSVVDSKTIIEWIYLGKVFVAVWNKIFKTSFLKNNAICFDERIWYGEGMLFNIDCLQLVDNVILGEKSVYHQVTNPDSAMRKFNLKSNMCGIRSLEIQKEHWKTTSRKINRAWNYHRHGFNWQIIRGLSLSGQKDDNKAIYDQCIRDLRKGFYKPLLVNIPFKSKISYVIMAVYPEFVIRREKKKIYNNC